MARWHARVFLITDYRLPITDYRLPITDYRLPITDYRLPITDYRLPITDYRLPITDYRLPITDHRLLITDHRSPITDHRLIVCHAPLASTEPLHFFPAPPLGAISLRHCASGRPPSRAPGWHQLTPQIE